MRSKSSFKSRKRMGGASAATLTVFALGTTWNQCAMGQVNRDRYESPPSPVDILSTDLNNDGNLDLAIAGDGGISLLLNQGDGTFGPRTHLQIVGGHYALYDLEAADLNRDGWNDVALGYGAQRIAVFLNNGDMTFSETRYSVGFTNGQAAETAFGDIDDDGDLDLIVGASNTRLAVLANDGNGSFSQHANVDVPSGNTLKGMCIGDYDDDGDLDVACGVFIYDYVNYEPVARNPKLVVMLNTSGDGTEWATTVYPEPTGEALIDQLEAADLNGDGRPDIVARGGAVSLAYEDHGGIHVYDNLGGGEFAEARGLYATRSAGFAVADMEGDGDLDLMVSLGWLSIPSSTVYLFNRFGGQKFVPFEVPHGRGTRDPKAITAIDVNGDGRWDSATACKNHHEPVTCVLYRDFKYKGVELQQTAIQRGERATFEILRAEPDRRAFVFYSMGEPGYTAGIGGLGGLMLDMNGPIFEIGNTWTDESGRAMIEVNVPLNAPLSAITTQGLIRIGATGKDSQKTNFVFSRIIE